MPDTKRNMEYEGVFGKSIIESIPGSFSICDVHGRLVCWNDYFRDNIIGKPESEMLNADAMDIFHPDDKAFAVDSMRNIFDLGIEVTAEGRVFLCGGPKYQWRMITGRRIMIDNCPYMIAVGIDITERKRFEALNAFRLRLLNMGDTYSVEELLRATLDEAQCQTGSPRGFCQLVSDDNISLSLRCLSGLQGKEERVYAMVSDLLLPEGEQYGGEPYSVLTYNDYEAYGLSDSCRDMRRALVVPLMQGTSAAAILCLGDKSFDYDDDDSRMVSALGTIVSDTVARKCAELSEQKMQEALLQAQKMELVGQLAGGIAHDFNNMLGVILGNVELALTRKVADESLIRNLQAILRAAEHSAGLTTQLLAFSRKQTVLPVVLELNLIIERMLAILRQLIGENISLVWIPESQRTLVKIDPTQIELILGNLCVNSRDSIHGSGRITIETSRVFIDKVECNAGHPCKEPGDYVMLVVSDNGCGIEKKDLPHIYEPFFTTKAVGKGTGMGLSTIYGIIKQNKAGIQCQSEKGKGTTFRIWLPWHSGYADPDKGQQSESPSFHGKEKILLVEDEPDILNICKLMLENNGYEVLTAATPGDAIHISSSHSGEIHLLLTDVVLPEMNGCDLSMKLSSARPQMKTLFMSGYTADTMPCRRATEGRANFIQKPFSINTLLSVVQKMFPHQD